MTEGLLECRQPPSPTNCQQISTVTFVGADALHPPEKTMIFCDIKRVDVGIDPYEMTINFCSDGVEANVLGCPKQTGCRQAPSPTKYKSYPLEPRA